MTSGDFTFHSFNNRFQGQTFTNPVGHRNTIDAEMPRPGSKRKLNSRNKTQYIGHLEFLGKSTLTMAGNDSVVNRSLGENLASSQPQFEDSHGSIGKHFIGEVKTNLVGGFCRASEMSEGHRASVSINRRKRRSSALKVSNLTGFPQDFDDGQIPKISRAYLRRDIQRIDGKMDRLYNATLSPSLILQQGKGDKFCRLNSQISKIYSTKIDKVQRNYLDDDSRPNKMMEYSFQSKFAKNDKI